MSEQDMTKRIAQLPFGVRLAILEDELNNHIDDAISSYIEGKSRGLTELADIERAVLSWGVQTQPDFWDDEERTENASARLRPEYTGELAELRRGMGMLGYAGRIEAYRTAFSQLLQEKFASGSAERSEVAAALYGAEKRISYEPEQIQAEDEDAQRRMDYYGR